MSLLRKLLPFLFKGKKQEKPATGAASRPKTAPQKQGSTSPRNEKPRDGRNEPRDMREHRGSRDGRDQRGPRDGRDGRDRGSREGREGIEPREEREPRPEREHREPGPIVGYSIIASCKNHRGIRKGSKVYIRQIMDDGDRLRVRATSPSGKKITLSVNRHALTDYESEGVPEHLAHHYSPDSIFQDEHEAKVKAEVLGKR